jgi:uncharacterized protein (DUF1697 family)
MTYVALLRGINVGGANVVRMSTLKACLEREGFERVATYIQTGNIVFHTPDRNIATLTRRVERTLSAACGFEIRIVLLSLALVKAIVEGAPAHWTDAGGLRCIIAFLKPPLKSAQAAKDVEIKDGVDVVFPGRGVLYMSTVLSGVTRSRLNRLPSRAIYQQMTLRNYRTCQKLLALMSHSSRGRR